MRMLDTLVGAHAQRPPRMRVGCAALCVLMWGCTKEPTPNCDVDGDGVQGAACGGADCADDDAAIHPGAAEVCDGVDNDCDGRAEDGPGTVCLFFTLNGSAQHSEVGFRFSPPLDVDGDGAADLAVGARVSTVLGMPHAYAGVWATGGAGPLRQWNPDLVDALFGHAVVLGPDVNGDARPDLVVSAPNAQAQVGAFKPVVAAYSVHQQEPLWWREYEQGSAVGWHLSRGWDVDGDGVEDILAGDPAGTVRRVVVLSGRDGAILRTVTQPPDAAAFGWFVVRGPDVDQDGTPEVLVGAPGQPLGSDTSVGAAYIMRIADGATLRGFLGAGASALLGDVVSTIQDLDGDGVEDVVVGAPGRAGTRAGQAFVFSAGTGAVLHTFEAADIQENYGRMVNRVGDVDGDGVDDVGVGAPWWAPPGGTRHGRMELRSGRDGHVLLELRGDQDEDWLGWHFEPALNLGSYLVPGLVVSALHHVENGVVNTGQLRVYVYGR